MRQPTVQTRPRGATRRTATPARAPLIAGLLALAVIGAGAMTFAATRGTTTSASNTSASGATHEAATSPAMGPRLDVAPGAFGPNRFLLTIPGATGQALMGAHVTLTFDMLDMPMGTPSLAAYPVGGGRYQAMGRLIMPGHWRITAVATGAGLPAGGVHASLRLDAPMQAGSAVPRPLPVVGPSARLASAVRVSAAAVRWTGLPYRAVVTFLSDGNVYIPGRATMLRVGALNHSIARAPNGTMWVTDYNGGRVAVVDPARGRIVASIPTGVYPVHIAFSTDGLRAYVSDYVSNDIAVIDVRARRKLATIDLQGNTMGPPGLHPHGLALSPDGRQLWVPVSMGGGVDIVDTRTDGIVATIFTAANGGSPHAVTFSPDGGAAYLTDAGRPAIPATAASAGAPATPASPAVPSQLVVIDTATRTIRARITIGTGSAMVAASRDGRRVYVTGQGGGVLTVVDARTLHVIARVPVGGAPHGLTFTPDGRLLYIASNNGYAVTVVDTRTLRVVATVPLPDQADELALWR